MKSQTVARNSCNQRPKITSKEEKTQRQKENGKTKGENDFLP